MSRRRGRVPVTERDRSGVLTEALVRLAAAMLPESRRPYYRELWLANLRDAAELGIPRGSLVRGALRFVITTSWSPWFRGLTPREAAIRRGRRGLALVLSAPVAFVATAYGQELEGGAGSAPGAASGIAQVAAVIGAVALVSGAVLLLTAAQRIDLLAFGGTAWALACGLLVVAGLGLGMRLVAAAGILFSFSGLWLALTGWLRGSRVVGVLGYRRVASDRARALAGALCCLGVLVVLGLGALDALVWSPLARDPLRPSSPPEAELAAVAFWALPALALLLLCLLPGRPHGRLERFTPRRIAVSGLVLASFAILSTGAGGTASWQGALVQLAGLVMLGAAILGGLLPARWRGRQGAGGEDPAAGGVSSAA